jgi:hypothetical protein
MSKNNSKQKIELFRMFYFNTQRARKTIKSRYFKNISKLEENEGEDVMKTYVNEIISNSHILSHKSFQLIKILIQTL